MTASASACDRVEAQKGQMAEAFLVYALKRHRIVSAEGIVNHSEITALLERCLPSDKRWASPKAERILTAKSMQA